VPVDLASDSVLLTAMAALFAGIAVMLSVALTSLRTAKDKRTEGMSRRLSIYTLTGRRRQLETTSLGDGTIARSAVELAGRVVARRNLDAVLAAKLDAAGVPLRAGEWAVVHLGILLGLPVLLALLTAANPLATLVGLVVGAVAPWTYLGVKHSRRLKAFTAQMPETLTLLAGSLQVGHSLLQGLDTVVRESQDPIAGEFGRALVEARLGVDVEDALQGVAERMSSKDFEWVVMAVRIQREVGGNLAEVLHTVAATLRERERLRRQVQTLSAEGRLSAWILGGLPVVFAGYLVLVRREYLVPLVTTTLGLLMVGLALVMLTVGILWLRKVVQVEV
jgi:tight adherence protein B